MAATRGRFLTTSMRKWDHEPLKPGEIGELHWQAVRDGVFSGRKQGQAACAAPAGDRKRDEIGDEHDGVFEFRTSRALATRLEPSEKVKKIIDRQSAVRKALARTIIEVGGEVRLFRSI